MVLLCRLPRKIRGLWAREGCYLTTSVSRILWKGLQWKELGGLCIAKAWCLEESLWATLIHQQRKWQPTNTSSTRVNQGNQSLILVSITQRSTPQLSAHLLWKPLEHGLCTCATLAQQCPDRSCSPHLTVAMKNQSLSSSPMIMKQ